jgi:cytochrome c
VSGLRTAGIAVVAIATSLLLARVHLFGDAGLYRARSSPAQIMENAAVPSAVRDLLTEKCADCHSNQTRSPVYGHFAPISWLMERDIVEGRKHMNLSEWDTYSKDQQQTFAAKIVQETKARHMPLPQYRMIHWNARITITDLQVLSQWARNPPMTTADSTPHVAAGDPVRGKALFEKRCTGCHALSQNHEGPKLQGVYGRTSAAVPGFPYSAALKSAHITWNDQTLDKWLADPDDFLPGNNMDFLVAKPQDRRDLIEYFKKSAGL